MKMLKFAGLVFVVGFFFALSLLVKTPDSTRASLICDPQSPCPVGTFCEDGYCVSSSGCDPVCAPGWTCSDGSCMQGPSGSPECCTQSDCTSGQVCSNGACIDDASGNFCGAPGAECPEGYICHDMPMWQDSYCEPDPLYDPIAQNPWSFYCMFQDPAPDCSGCDENPAICPPVCEGMDCDGNPDQNCDTVFCNEYDDCWCIDPCPAQGMVCGVDPVSFQHGCYFPSPPPPPGPPPCIHDGFCDTFAGETAWNCPLDCLF